MQNSAATDSHPAQTFDPFRTIRCFMSEAAQRAGFKSVRRVKRTASRRVQTLEERVVSLGSAAYVNRAIDGPDQYPVDISSNRYPSRLSSFGMGRS